MNNRTSEQTNSRTIEQTNKRTIEQPNYEQEDRLLRPIPILQIFHFVVRSSFVQLFNCSPVRPRAPRGSKRGSVLILALWVLFFLAALAVAVGAHVSAALKLAGSMQMDARGYHLARAGVTHAARVVACNTNDWDGWSEAAWNADPETFSDQIVGDDGRFSIINLSQAPDGEVEHVGLVGAESRLNLNRSDKQIFIQLFVQVGGVSSGQAESIYEAVKVYRQEKQQHLLTIRTANGYPEGGSGGEAVLDSVHELLLVKGVDDGLFGLVEPYVTVFGSGRINANTASSELLLCCAAAYPAAAEGVDEIIRARGSTPFRSDGDLSAFSLGPIRGRLTAHSTAFYGIAVGRTTTGAEAARIEFAVDGSKGLKGYRRYWHEF